jgi:hypothetical protein
MFFDANIIAQDRLAKDIALGKWPYEHKDTALGKSPYEHPPHHQQDVPIKESTNVDGDGPNGPDGPDYTGPGPRDPFEAWCAEVHEGNEFHDRPYHRLKRAQEMAESEQQKWRERGCPAMMFLDEKHRAAKPGAIVVTDFGTDPRADLSFAPDSQRHKAESGRVEWVNKLEEKVQRRAQGEGGGGKRGRRGRKSG